VIYCRWDALTCAGTGNQWDVHKSKLAYAYFLRAFRYANDEQWNDPNVPQLLTTACAHAAQTFYKHGPELRESAPAEVTLYELAHLLRRGPAFELCVDQQNQGAWTQLLQNMWFHHVQLRQRDGTTFG
jgi:hypothetical protein